MMQMESMVERLYTTKPNHGMTYKSRPKPMKAIYYIENGAHLSRLEPIPPKPAQERTDFMVCLRSDITDRGVCNAVRADLRMAKNSFGNISCRHTCQ